VPELFNRQLVLGLLSCKLVASSALFCVYTIYTVAILAVLADKHSRANLIGVAYVVGHILGLFQSQQQC
jgi:uncharacterized protein YebE (UPF0316 family)